MLRIIVSRTSVFAFFTALLALLSIEAPHAAALDSVKAHRLSDGHVIFCVRGDAPAYLATRFVRGRRVSFRPWNAERALQSLQKTMKQRGCDRFPSAVRSCRRLRSQIQSIVAARSACGPLGPENPAGSPSPSPTTIPSPSASPSKSPSPEASRPTATPSPSQTTTPQPSATPSNPAARSLGMNLPANEDWSSAWTFVDAFHSSRPWISGDSGRWDNGQPLTLDADGWVRFLSPGQIARTLMLTDLSGVFPSGDYVVLYDGEGVLEFNGGASLLAAESRPGRAVIRVAPSRGGILLSITQTNPNNYVRKIRVIMPGGACSNDPFSFCDSSNPCGPLAGQCASFESNYGTQIFHPTFLKRLLPFRSLRFMDWMKANNSRIRSWNDRPKLSDSTWTSKGVPLEIMLELANRLSANAWFTMPHLATDDYVAQFAQTVSTTLHPELKVFVEYSNELWNGIFEQANYAKAQGLQLGLAADGFTAQLRFGSRRSVQIFRIWEQVFGGTSRLRRIIAAQAANSWTGQQMLEFEGAYRYTDALAIAPYFGGEYGTPEVWPSVSNQSVSQFLQTISTGSLPHSIGWMQANARLARDRGVRLVAYESGQHLTGILGLENDTSLNALFDSANRSSEMEALYDRYLEEWKNAGGEEMMLFSFCGRYSKWGRWGVLEYLDQLPSQAPKYRAIERFSFGTRPWWSESARQ